MRIFYSGRRLLVPKVTGKLDKISILKLLSGGKEIKYMGFIFLREPGVMTLKSFRTKLWLIIGICLDLILM